MICSAGAYPHQWCLLGKTGSLSVLVMAGMLPSNHAGSLVFAALGVRCAGFGHVLGSCAGGFHREQT